MKKTLSIVLALVLALSAVMLFSGCGIEKKVVGTWKTTIDFTDKLNEMLTADGGEEMAEYFTIKDYKFDVVLAINEDGTYKMSADEASIKTAMTNIGTQLTEGMVKMLEDMFKDAGMDMTVEEYLDMQGMTMDDLTKEMMDSINEEDFTGMESTGTYVIEDTKIKLTEVGEDGTAVTDIYEYVDGTIKVVEINGIDESDEDAQILKEVFSNLVFKKA